MSKFCNQCGKTLADGEVCTCSAGAPPQGAPQPQYAQQPQQQYAQQQYAQQPQQQYAPPQQPAPQYAPPQGYNNPPQQAPIPPQGGQYYAQQPMQTVPAAPSAAGMYMSRLFKTFAQGFKSPAQVLGGMTAAGDSQVGVGFIAMQGLAFAIFMACLLGRYNSTVDTAGNAVSSIADMFGGEGIEAAASLMLKFSLPTVFIASLLISVGMGFAFAGIMLLFHVVMGKGAGAYKHMLCAAGSRSLATIPFLLVGSLTLFLSIPVGFGIAGIGLLLGVFFTGCSIDACGQPDKSKQTYTVFLAFIVFALASLIVFCVVAPTLLPGGIKAALSGADTVAGLLGMLK